MIDGCSETHMLIFYLIKFNQADGFRLVHKEAQG